MFDKMVQKPQSLFIFFHPTIVTNGRDIGFFEVLLASLFDYQRRHPSHVFLFIICLHAGFCS